MQGILLECYAYEQAELSNEVIWLDFKPAPTYDKERKEIKLSDKIYYAQEYNKYLSVRKANESTNKKEYEKQYSYNHDYLKRNPYKYPEFEIPEINYNIIAILDEFGKAKDKYAFIVSKTITESMLAGQADIRVYIKGHDRNSRWRYISSVMVDSDFGIRKDSKADFIVAGCQDSGVFLSPRGNFRAINLVESAKKAKPDNKKVVSIVSKQLKYVIKKAKDEYKKEAGIEYNSPLRISGIFIDLNGDGKKDIIAEINDPEYQFREPDGKMMSTGSRFQLFCSSNDGCEHFLLINNGRNKWQTISFGYATCVGLSKKNKNGIIDKIVTEKATVVWNGSSYDVIKYSPNWMLNYKQDNN